MQQNKQMDLSVCAASDDSIVQLTY